MIYGDVFEGLEAEGVRYVVVGGMAVVLHGHERHVKDLDIVVDPAPVAARRVAAALMSLGFVPTLPLPLEMLTVLTMIDGAGRVVDVFARYHVPFGELWSASERVRAGEGLVRICSIEHLIRVKHLVTRPDDPKDIEALLAIERTRGAGEALETKEADGATTAARGTE
jgi:hypothetical protein